MRPLRLALAALLIGLPACASTPEETTTPEEEASIVSDEPEEAPPQDFSLDAEEGGMCIEPPPDEPDPEPCD